MAEAAIESDPAITLGRLTDVTAATVGGASLDVALEALGTTPEMWVTVTDSDEHVVGIFTTSGDRWVPPGLGNEHRAALDPRRQRRPRGGPCRHRCRSHRSGHQRRRSSPGTIVVTVERHGALLFGEASTVLESGDLVSALALPIRSTGCVAGWKGTPRTTTCQERKGARPSSRSA